MIILFSTALTLIPAPPDKPVEASLQHSNVSIALPKKIALFARAGISNLLTLSSPSSPEPPRASSSTPRQKSRVSKRSGWILNEQFVQTFLRRFQLACGEGAPVGLGLGWETFGLGSFRFS